MRQSIRRSVSTAVNGAKLSFGIVMEKLFSNGEQGFFYDPNDLSTMFQDAAGTVPVTAVGQPVGLVKDKSGRNNHAYQTNAASRPLLQRNATTGAYYLEFDGSDDFLVTNNINFTATDKISLFAGVRKLSDESLGMIAELSYSAGVNNGTFYLSAPFLTAIATRFYTRGNNGGQSTINPLASEFAGQVPMVLSVRHQAVDFGMLQMRVNQSEYPSVNRLAIGNFGNYPLYIGRRGGTTYQLNGHIYGLIGVGKLTSGSETAAIEKELAKRTGVAI